MLDFSSPFLEKGEKLVCFGDSLTEQQCSYVNHLKAALPDNEIINSGLGGDKTTAALTRLEQDVISHHPDAVFIMFGANDAAVGRNIWADEPVVTPEAYRCNLIWLAHICRMRGISKISIATAFGFEGEAFNRYGRVIEPYYLAARAAADEAKARLVPLDSLFDSLRGGAPLSETRVNPDGTHPSPETYEKIAKAILKAWNL